jgi:hypothetical protein
MPDTKLIFEFFDIHFCLSYFFAPYESIADRVLDPAIVPINDLSMKTNNQVCDHIES